MLFKKRKIWKEVWGGRKKDLGEELNGSKTLMHVFDRFEDTDLIAELLNGMHAELPEKKPKKTK